MSQFTTPATLSEDGIRTLVRRTAESEARFIYPAFGMTRRTGQREYFYQKLDCYFQCRQLKRLRKRLKVAATAAKARDGRFLKKAPQKL